MSTTVTYKGAEIAALENETKTLKTGGTWLEGDITIEDVTAGGSSYTLLGEHTYTVNTTSTQAANTGTINCGSAASTAAKMIYVRVRDTAGPRNGYFYGSDAFFINVSKGNGSTSTLTAAARIIHRLATGGTWGQYQAGSTTGYGVYGYSVSNAGAVVIRQRYNSNYSLTIKGTYKVEVYALDWPDGASPYTD